MNETMGNPQQRAGCACGGAGPQATAMFRGMWTQATQDHFRNARLEFLKGVRSVIDHRIDRLSRDPHQKGTSVPVE